MPIYSSTIKRVLLFAYLVALHIVAVYFILQQLGFIVPLVDPARNTAAEPTQAHTPDQSSANATALPSPIIARPTPDNVRTPVNSPSLAIPVAGVTASQLTDTFDQARSGGRVHDAIDIPAPAGTAVVAAVDGVIIKFHNSELGGITIYQLSEDRNFVFYYAHLQRRMESLREGDRVRRGDQVGYVGDTGNAGTGNYHLHFAIWHVTDAKRFWSGENLNPYPLLRDGLPLPAR